MARLTSGPQKLIAMDKKKSAAEEAAAGTRTRERFVALQERYQADDARAGEELYRRYCRHILRRVRHRFLPPGDRKRRLYDAADLVQVAFAAIFKTLDEGGKFLDEESLFHFVDVVLLHWS